jgi:hypothetical protein
VAEPSRQDDLLTERLKESLETLDVRLLDHFVVGDGEVIFLQRARIAVGESPLSLRERARVRGVTQSTEFQ